MRQQREDRWCNFSCLDMWKVIFDTEGFAKLIFRVALAVLGWMRLTLVKFRWFSMVKRRVELFIFIFMGHVQQVSAHIWHPRRTIANRSIFWSTADSYREWKLWRSCVKQLSLPAAALPPGFAPSTPAAANACALVLCQNTYNVVYFSNNVKCIQSVGVNVGGRRVWEK